MAETTTTTTHADIDVRVAVQKVMHDSYPPLMHDRHRIDFTAQDGKVTISGHVKAPMTASYLLNKVQAVRGVQSVDMSGLIDDEAVRMEVGKVVPPGVQIIVEYGAVILAGAAQPDLDLEALVGQIGQIAGVHRVLTSFS